jgi:hypothetical protein
VKAGTFFPSSKNSDKFTTWQNQIIMKTRKLDTGESGNKITMLFNPVSFIRCMRFMINCKLISCTPILAVHVSTPSTQGRLHVLGARCKIENGPVCEM